MPRSIILLCSACLAALPLAGCGPAPATPPPATAPAASAAEADPVRIDPIPPPATLPVTRPVRTHPELTAILDALDAYRAEFRENPAGFNDSIAAALLGDNPSRTVFLPRARARLDADGQLLDPWGSPYFFHALSGRVMEVVSPGPDRTRGTDDDLAGLSSD